MADRHKPTGRDHLPKATIIFHGRPYYRKKARLLRSPESTRLRGLMALLVSTGILLVLSGPTVTTAVTSFMLVAPIIIITSPLWVPAGILMLFLVAMVLCVCGLGVAAAVVLVIQLLIKGR